MKEKWKFIEGLEGKYQISNYGNVFNVRTHKLLKPSNINGYRRVNISKIGTFYIHILVAKHFIPNPKNKPCINHIDCNKANNKVSNLEWCTYKENTKHAWENGLCEKGREVAKTLAVRGWETRKKLSKGE